jgi:hypothetical protein
MIRTLLAALILGALFAATTVRAQAPQNPDAKPTADAKQEPAAPAAPRPGDQPDPKIIEDLMGCLATGLTEDWKRAWFVIRETGRDKTGKDRRYEGNFFYATDVNDRKGKRLKICGPEKILEGVGKLNEYLPGDQQRWTGATFSFYRDGRFEVAYDFTPPKPAAKPAAKKKQEAGK